MPDDQLVEHTTIEGQTLWQIAQLRYADSTLTWPIVRANPGVPMPSRFDGGITLYIPVKKEDDNNTIIPKELQPPWRQ